MSLDNSIAIAAAAKGNMYLVVFGLLLSVPIIIAGSALILKLMSRFPIIISLGAGLLGWLAGDLIVHDPLLENFLTSHLPYADLVMAGGLAGVVILVGQTLASRQKAI
jgi:predicted tellurium resistance membrane protein TerC